MAMVFAVLLLAMQQDGEPPAVLHTPIRQAPAGSEFVVQAEIADPSGIFEPKLYWRLVGAKDYAAVTMEEQGGANYAASIPGWKITGDMDYFLEAYDTVGNGPTRVGSLQVPIRVKVIGTAPAAAQAPAEEEKRQAPAAAVVAEPSRAFPVWQTSLLGAGVVAAAVGTILFLGASSAVEEIDGKYQAGMGRSPADADATRAAQSRGKIGSVLLIGGAVLTAGGGASFAIDF